MVGTFQMVLVGLILVKETRLKGGITFKIRIITLKNFTYRYLHVLGSLNFTGNLICTDDIE